jgi:type III secretory pathway lipoprotein EscJ
MKKIFSLFTLATLLLLSSCSVFNPNVSSSNLNQTQVVLQSNNFKVIKKVEGSASATYILGIGGLGKKGLVSAARKDMYDNSGIVGSQVIISEHTEWKTSNLIPYVWGRAVVTTSGYLIEFTGK